MFGHLITPTFWDFSCRLPTGAARLRAARPLGVPLVACDYLPNSIMLFSQMSFVMKLINRYRKEVEVKRPIGDFMVGWPRLF